jgi:hypothetical protein
MAALAASDFCKKRRRGILIFMAQLYFQTNRWGSAFFSFHILSRIRTLMRQAGKPIWIKGQAK